MKHHVIGIDLGTTYSAVATWDEDEEQAVILTNPEAGGEGTTPSVVGLHPATRKVIVGLAAKRNLAADPHNTVIEIKRDMGEEFDPDKHTIPAGFRAGDPVRVRFAEFPEQWLMPQEISSFVLMKMKEIAEHHFGEEVRDAVVTVPAYFHAIQKRATEQAALLAGLYPRQLVPEPTAAAICYGVDRYSPERQVYLVYDLGGGTFDVSIIVVQEESISVVATAGNSRLGGTDFDNAITDWAVGELLQKAAVDVRADAGARAAVKYEAEQAKIRLSTHASTTLQLGVLKPEAPPVLELTREKFEELIEVYLSHSMSAVEKALQYAAENGVDREDLTAILLVGGSSRIPKVRQQLMDYFQKGEEFVHFDLDPASVVARGAAILARRFKPSEQAFDVRRRPDTTMVDTSMQEDLQDLLGNIGMISEHSLGVGVQDDRVVRVIPRGTSLPTSITKMDFANPGPVEYLKAPVYQGEGETRFENTLIGEVELGPMEPLPKDSHQFHVTFAIDASGLLDVTVNHVNEKRVYQAKFERDTAVKSDDVLEAMRSKLLGLYQPMSMTAAEGAAREQVAPPGPGGYVPPPPPGAAAPPAPAPTSGAGEAEAAEEATAPAAAADEASPAEEAPAAAAKAPPDAPLPAEPENEVPDQFKSIVRRASKHLLRQPDPELLKAFNDFVAALDAGRPEEDLIDLGDELADAYVDARARAR